MKIDKITFLLLAFQLISNVGFGQADSFSGTTTHKGKAIAYVNIGIQGKAIGTVSDENGEFTLYLNRTKLSNEDTLVFSRIGYSSMYFSFIQLNEIMASKHPLSIELDEKVEQLNEVIVRSRVAKTKEIGSIKKSLLNMNVNFSIAQYPNQNLGSEIGRKFNIRKQHTKIMSFRFYLQHNNFDDVKFRLNIYDIEKNGRPRKNLLTEHIVLNVRGRKTGWIEVDLSPFSIIVNQDVIVALEWIAKSTTGTMLSFPIVMPSPSVHYYKFGSQNNWKKYNTMSTQMRMTIRY